MGCRCGMRHSNSNSVDADSHSTARERSGEARPRWLSNDPRGNASRRSPPHAESCRWSFKSAIGSLTRPGSGRSPYTSPGGKNVHARVRRVDQPATAEERTWGAHERIAVRRATSEEDK